MTASPELSVQLWGTLRSKLEGRERVTVEASTIREMLDRLADRYPELALDLESGVSVSVDGAIYNGSWSKPLDESQEIVLLPRIKGG